ncbi:ArsR family transcriptional regulator [Arthrobacter sp. SRS-W-1-2016]|jgi:DNA-binding MarR family transcriptional regulator|uniref:winged helix-turn-helix domain-containing protein n=1 Tax=Arthrobacter sp. SRS-W-1-2016 TaxID=1930254 RepID=UPI000990EDED|nr:transcriptional regulator [Arthrobacter sp. SRS-W-1-2016]OOP61890.1 ArsR family transcriptional regulator [Arthrobacter sp. SRS-W-1-2016]
MSVPAEHPHHRLNELIHSPVRFSVMAALAGAESLDFKDLLDTIQVSDSLLSKQLAVLEKAGYVKIRKSFAGKMPRTSASLTPHGHEAWTGHLQTLREIAGG